MFGTVWLFPDPLKYGSRTTTIAASPNTPHPTSPQACDVGT